MYTHASPRPFRPSHLLSLLYLALCSPVVANAASVEVDEIPGNLTELDFRWQGFVSADTVAAPPLTLQRGVIVCRATDPSVPIDSPLRWRTYYAVPAVNVITNTQPNASVASSYFHGQTLGQKGTQAMVGCQFARLDGQGSTTFYGMSSYSTTGQMLLVGPEGPVQVLFNRGFFQVKTQFYRYDYQGPNNSERFVDLTETENTYKWYEVTNDTPVPTGDNPNLPPGSNPGTNWGNHPDNPNNGNNGGTSTGSGSNLNPMEPGPEDPGVIRPRDSLPQPPLGSEASEAVSDANNVGLLTVSLLKLLTFFIESGNLLLAPFDFPDPMPRIGEDGLDIPAFGTVLIPPGKPIWFPVAYIALMFNDFLPVREAILILVAGVGVMVALPVYKGIKIVINVVRGSGA